MLLSNCNIVVAVVKALGELHHARALAHGRGDCNKPLIGNCGIAKPLAKDLRIGWLRCPGCFKTFGRIKLTRTMVGNGIFFSTPITPALAGYDMEKLRPLKLAQVLKCGNKCIEIVTINRPKIIKTKLLKQGAWRNKTFRAALEPSRDLEHRRHNS